MRSVLSLLLLSVTIGLCAQTPGSNNLAAFYKLQEQADRDEAFALALAYRLPLRQELPDGRVIESK